MSTVRREEAEELDGRAAVPGSEPVGRTERDGGAAPEFGVEGLPPGGSAMS